MPGKRVGIVLFIGGLPGDCSSLELGGVIRDRIQEERQARLFCKSDPVRCCDIIRITDLNTRARALHALVEIRPAKLGLLALSLLQGCCLRNHPLTVRRYYHRSLLRDRRKKVIDQTPARIKEKRAARDRRRDEISIELLDRKHREFLPGSWRWLRPRHPLPG